MSSINQKNLNYEIETGITRSHQRIQACYKSKESQL